MYRPAPGPWKGHAAEAVVEIVELLYPIAVDDQPVPAQLHRVHGPPTHWSTAREFRYIAHFHEQSVGGVSLIRSLSPETLQGTAGEWLGRIGTCQVHHGRRQITQ